VLVGTSGIAVLDGTTWAVSQVDQASGGLVSVSCVDAGFCAAVDADGNVSNWDGTTWSNPVPVDSPGRPTAISCRSRTLCALVDDQGWATTYDGTTWSSPTGISASPLRSVSCAPPGDTLGDAICVAVGDDKDAHYLVTGGWARESSIDDAALRDVSCVTRRWCVAVDEVGRSVTYSNGAWSAPVTVDSSNIVHDLKVSCPVQGFCAAVAQWGGSWTYDGTSWSDTGSFDGPSLWDSPHSVSCAGAAFCTTAMSGGTATYDGTAWTAPDLAFGTGLTDVSCPSSSFCAAVDDYGNARVYE
jgi:hypothetical protein